MGAGDGPGVAALELRQAVQAQAGQLLQVVPVACAQRQGGAGRWVFHERRQVSGAQLVADMREQRLAAQRGGEAVGHVAGDGQAVLGAERARLQAEQVELQRCRAARLVVVDPLQIGLQCQEGRALLVAARHVLAGVLAQAQGAEQPVGIQQCRAEHLGQLAIGQAAQHLHLEQAVLGMHEAQRPVQVGVVLRTDMRHPALVVAHLYRRLQARHAQPSVAQRLLVGQVISCQPEQGDEQQQSRQQQAFHRCFSRATKQRLCRCG